MRKFMAGITALLLVQGVSAKTLTVAQDYAVDSDVVLESALREVKSAPRDTVNVVGDAIKYVSDEVVTAAKGAKAVFKTNPVDKAEKAGILEIANAWDSSNDIVFRSYKVTPEVAQELLSGVEAAPGAVVDVSDFFTGIDFPQHTSAYLRPEFNRLFVRQTLSNLFSIEDVLAEQHSAVRDLMGKQVEIETKFVEVNQSFLNELGFDWNFVSKYGGDANIFENLTLPANTDLLVSALRTAGSIASGKTAAFDAALTDSDTLTLTKEVGSLRWEMVIRALEQSDDADVLSAPSIVTRDGSKATIEVGEERMVASSFEVKNSETSLYVENELDKELMGVTLEVTPEIRSDNLLDLKLKPKVIDLIGYDLYQAHPAASMLVWSGEDAGGLYVNGRFPILNVPGAGISTAWDLFSATLSGGDPNSDEPGNGLKETDAAIYYDSNRPIRHEEYGIPLRALNGRIPYYRLREIETQVTVEDGSTVGMGGLIYDKLETFKDKVPVLGSIPLLGRLFRSEGEKSIKRNLMIFVTATQVDVNGRRASDLALKK